MKAQIFIRTYWHICLLAIAALIAMIILIAISPQWLATASIAFLGTILGSLITLLTQWLITKKESIDRFRLAALDKRLETHQEGYHLWRKLLASLKDEEKCWEWIAESQDWYEKHCLYLDPESRRAFRLCIVNASFWGEDYSADQRREMFQEIMETGDYLAKGVDLPPIGESEKEILSKDMDKSK